MFQQPRIDRVALSVSNLERSVDFYTELIGLTQLENDGTVARLGAGDRTLLQLHHQPGARPIRRATGLYHFALLLPSRAALGAALQHYGANNAPLSGFADHAVSEAIYLTDPDGHGIEVYRDRAASEWEYPNGELRMTVDPLDVEGILEAAEPSWSKLPPDTVMGHIHLQVANIAATEAFYTELLGFDVITRYGPGATFLATDSYHHHIGANTWMGVGLAPAPHDAARLLEYTILVDSVERLTSIGSKLRATAHPYIDKVNELILDDPSAIRVRIRLR